ncbi:MAG TPA: IPT/TIG domain-containing protein [Pyrinomonadaceae bacterium]|nr:IPT/TIG domain-containing protein [Pyrinomonadaceae bacterium]
MIARTRLSLFVGTLALACFITSPGHVSNAQSKSARVFRPDLHRALSSRKAVSDVVKRAGAYVPQRSRKSAAIRTRTQSTGTHTQSTASGAVQGRRPIRPRAIRRSGDANSAGALQQTPEALPRVSTGTPLGRVLHTSQLSLTSSNGTHEQFVDRNGNFVADERTTFDASGGSFDVAVGRTGARYEVFSAIDDRGTGTTSDDLPTGILVVALDTNGDYVRDTSSTFDLGRDFNFPSAVSVVAGTSNGGREFVVVSSSGYYNSDNPNDPNNEDSPGVVLLVRDSATGGFDNSRSRSLLSVGDNRIFNANALTLLPSGDLVIADFQSNELRIVRDTDGDAMPDTLDAAPYYTFPFSANAEDAPLDIAANSRGVVFSHSVGNDTRLLAIYDDDRDGFAEVDEIRVEGLSIDNNLVLHGLTVERDGTVYVIEDALGESDLPADGGNGGIPRIDAFPDPALNGILRDGAIFAEADDPFTQALTGLSFGVDTVFGAVGRLTATNSASFQGSPTHGGLATILGNNLTRGARGATQSEATASGISVTVEGVPAPVLSFADSQIHISIPNEVGAGVGSFVVYVNGNAVAADDVNIKSANPGIFTLSQTGAGEAVALLVSGNRYTTKPFPATFENRPSVIALFGTGWRNSILTTVTVGGKPARAQYVGASGGFPGLDQINVEIPDGVSGAAPVVVTTANGAASRNDVFVTVQ